MIKPLRIILTIGCFFQFFMTFSQIIINEGSNKNYSTIADEDNEYPDWIELYNAGSDPVDLFNYSLTDDSANAQQWTFPHLILFPGEYKVIYCDGKDRYEAPAATLVSNDVSFVPTVGWNTHVFTTPFIWDGVSNIAINTCSYSSAGYISNSVFNQTYTPFNSCVFAVADGSPSSCSSAMGSVTNMRPNMRLNDQVIGTGSDQNCNTCYPAPYGNWYWGSRHQMLILAEELLAAGLTAGPIDSLSFDVAATDVVLYDYIEVQMNPVSISEMDAYFVNMQGYQYHTNFGISSNGESVFLYGPDGALVSTLNVGCESYDISNGAYPDGNAFVALFEPPTPGASNNDVQPSTTFLISPEFSYNSGFYSSVLSVTISNPNGPGSTIHYTTDSSDPTEDSPIYDGNPITVFQSTVIRARAFKENYISSPTKVATYFFGVSHVTPILSVTTDYTNLYGPTGNFDNPMNDWDKAAYMEYFDSIPTHPLLFSQQCGMIQDGGWGGSRTQPQRSFRLKMTDGVLGGDPMEYEVIPHRAGRDVYSDFYLRNGSNQYLTLPYKDASQVQMMGGETNNYFSAWRPITVYINGQYFGLYELREKFNKEKFMFEDNATDSTIEILSLSAFYGGVFRAVEGDTQNFIDDLTAYSTLDVMSDDYWDQTDQYFDLEYYTDYIIAESWMGNVDWPGNNIKIYRSDATDYRWRYCLIDLELSLLPNSWTDCTTDHISYLLSQGTGNPFVAVWYASMFNPRYHDYFINRFADIMNTSYQADHLLEIENEFFDQTVIEMANEYQRWGDPFNVPAWLNAFYDNHMIFQSELACRSEQVRNHLQSNFSLGEQVQVEIDVVPAGAGRIILNTITPESLPWTGIYFQGVPVTMTAIPNPGYSFSYWISNDLIQIPILDSIIQLDISTSDSFDAVFSGTPAPSTIAFNEINYNSDDTQYSGDWIELHNYGTSSMNLTGWSLTNEHFTPRYELPYGTTLHPDEYLVLVRDTASFMEKYPAVQNFIGPIPFDLDGSNGGVILYDHFTNVITNVSYADSLPWPEIAAGGGRTLELLNSTSNNADPLNWFAGCMFGSPGEAFHPCPEQIVFSEINYESSPTANAGDWVELRNVGDVPVDVSGWYFRDDETNNLYQIPSATILDPQEMLVLSSDLNLFDVQHPEVTNRVGGFEFGLSPNGEMIRLYNDQDKLYFSMKYRSDNDWPLSPNAQGYTLELLDSTGNFNIPSNWFSGCLQGSPGVFYTDCGIISVEETHTGNNEMSIFPNPTDGIAQIYFQEVLNSSAYVQVFDSYGRLIESTISNRTQHGFNIDLGSLASGWYVMKVIDGEDLKLAKILKR